MRKMRVLSAIIILTAIFYIVYEYTPLINRNGITIDIKSPDKYFSKYKDIDISISDKNAGIKNILVQIVSMNTIIKLYNKTIGDNFIKHFNINFKTNKIVPDGKAVLIVRVTDYSKNNFLSGFEKTIKRDIIVDSKKPVVHLLSGISRIRITGTGLAIYYAKDSNLKEVYVGVRHDGVTDKFRAFDASKLFNKKNVYLSFFTYPLSKNKNYSTDVYAIDTAGNVTKVHVPVYYSDLRLRKSKINITDNFIKNKVLTIMDNENIPQKSTLLDDFLYVNDVVRKQNREKIKQICQKSIPSFLWRGRFEQLHDSKVTATFADKRSYYYKGKLVDIKYHMGYDLASVRNAKINAANNGIVIFEGYLGVYGNAMIIDHGFGIFSLYGHQREFLVKVGQKVKKGQYIGITDTTGLAGGDHLHFDVLVDGYYVNPIDWWDSHWIKTHVTSVISEARTRLSLLE